MAQSTQNTHLTRSEILARLADKQVELRRRFRVASLEVFGSTARDAAGFASDIDIMVTFEEPVGLFHFFALQDYLESLLDGQPVDLVMRDAILEEMRERVFAEAISIVE